jgi:hypothetical protein
MNTTTNTTVRRVATTAVMAGAAVLTGAPAFAGVPPEDIGAVSATSQIKTQTGNAGATGGLSAQTKAKVEQMEKAIREPQPATQPAGSTSNPSDPSSVPVTLLALLGGTLVAGAAGFTVYRFRHNGPVGAATA